MIDDDNVRLSILCIMMYLFFDRFDTVDHDNMAIK